MAKDEEIIRTSLRLPKALYDKLEQASGGRTMHAEIIARLEASFEDAGTQISIEFLEKTVQFAVSKTMEMSLNAIRATTGTDPEDSVPREKIQALEEVFERMLDKSARWRELAKLKDE